MSSNDDKVAAAIDELRKDLRNAINKYMIFWGTVIVVLGVVDVGFMLHLF